MYEPARRLLYVIAGMAASICVSAAPTLTAAQGVAGLVDLRVPSDEPRYAAIVIDASTGEILYQKRADSPRYPASVTKVMTLYLAFEALSSGKLHENDLITISPLAASQPPTKLGLRPGDTITVADAMHAMAVHSANDMAMALAEKIGGSESRFAAMMTMKAHELGMNNSRFVNPNGLPDSRHVSTARDIAILCEAVLRDYPQYYHYFGDDEFTYRGVTYRNTNHLLGSMPGVDGFKTGFTNAAGYNLAASAVRNGHRLITVVLGGSSGAARNANVEDLLLTGFDIEARRDHGERIQLTQNLFEQPPAQGVTLPQLAQGDVSDPIDVVLKDSSQGRPVAFGSAPVAQLSASRPSLIAEAPSAGLVKAEAQDEGAGDWRVHVGAFDNSKLATHQVDLVADTFSSIFDDRPGEVDHVGRRYEAVFTGFTQAEAADACGKVKADGMPCVASRR
ncbi:MAG TPA: D-alanyl-D-alanine carboxypeptidase family protein [Caulobacteraceae bacterium]|nr:D-alanyl-D-alanine carboxypeptidase family protein [Caulobacteraceae bacterium]